MKRILLLFLLGMTVGLFSVTASPEQTITGQAILKGGNHRGLVALKLAANHKVEPRIVRRRGPGQVVEHQRQDDKRQNIVHHPPPHLEIQKLPDVDPKAQSGAKRTTLNAVLATQGQGHRNALHKVPSNARETSQIKDSFGKKINENHEGLGGEKRNAVPTPEDRALQKGEETMVVIDEEADGDAQAEGGGGKETPGEAEGFTIVLENSISHNANEEKNKKSLSELSRSFTTMDKRMEAILQSERERQAGKQWERRQVRKKAVRGLTGKRWGKQEDLGFEILGNAKLKELQRQLQEEGTDDEFAKLMKESKHNGLIEGNHGKLVVETDDRGRGMVKVKEHAVAGTKRKEVPRTLDPLDRFTEEQSFPIITERDDGPSVIKIRSPGTEKPIRKAALPLTNPHPTTSVPIKGQPWFPGARNITETQAKEVFSTGPSKRGDPEGNRTQEEHIDTIVTKSNPYQQIEGKFSPTTMVRTLQKHVHPTSSITLDLKRGPTNSSEPTSAPTSNQSKEEKMNTSPVIATRLQPTSIPSRTFRPEKQKVPPTNNETKKDYETAEQRQLKNSTSVKITITPDSHSSDDDEEDPSTGQHKAQVIDPWKAQTMLEYINKDPLEVWIYVYKNLRMLGLNSTMLRNGLVNAGSIDRIKGAMKRALRGEDITLSIVGGSISAGGGLYKDRGNIDGLYYKGLVDWWNKAITPLTGSSMIINNVAIGSIGTDYFSYCVKNHIVNETDLVLWELSGNDYNRYVTLPTKGAKPLERLTRMILQLPRKPALLYVNFFKGIDYKVSKTTCPNFEDQGEDIIAHYYKLPSLSWRSMVCEPLLQHQQLFTLRTLFSNDQYHPSLRAHAQMSLLLILHLRHVMRSVLKWAADHGGTIPDFADNYMIPPPLFVGLEQPHPSCWTLISPDLKERIQNSLQVKVVQQTGFKLDYATNFPVRYDRVICWKAEAPGSEIQLRFRIPPKAQASTKESRKSEVAITTHTRWFGSAEVWLDDRPESPPVIEEGRKGDTGRRTQVDVVARDVDAGEHTLTVRAKALGFCLAAIMVN